MTKILIDKETVELAFEALSQGTTDMRWKAIESLRQALEQSTEQEPVAWLHWLHGPVRLFMNKDEAMMELDRLNREYPVDSGDRQMKPLYTTPPQRQPLTFEEVEDCFPERDACFEDAYGERHVSPRWLHEFARAIEAAHGITGEKE